MIWCIYRLGHVVIAQLITNPCPSCFNLHNNAYVLQSMLLVSDSSLPVFLSKSPLWEASSLFEDVFPLPFPSSVCVHVRCVHVHMQTTGRAWGLSLPGKFSNSSGSYIKTICGKQNWTFAINWEGKNRANN